MPVKDYYATLRIPQGADATSIKKAFRTLAMEYHPDKRGENPENDHYFREIKGSLWRFVRSPIEGGIHVSTLAGKIDGAPVGYTFKSRSNPSTFHQGRAVHFNNGLLSGQTR